MSILIQHGTVIDGTGKKGYTADVLIDGDRIRAIGQIEPSGEMQCVDASGCVVAPGFIDTHTVTVISRSCRTAASCQKSCRV